MRHPDGLSERERRFVENFMGRAHGNGAKAARLAGYSKRSARVTASVLLAKPNIRHAIEARVRADSSVATREQIQQFLSAILRGDGPYVLLRMRDRLKATELLGKSHKMFSERIEVTGTDGGPIVVTFGGRHKPRQP